MAAMRIDSASRTVVADLARVHRALTDPDDLVAWLPPQGMTGRFERFDADGYRLVLRYDEIPDAGGKASADEDVADVRRVEVTPTRVVEQVDFPSDDPAYGGTMTMTWTLAEVPDGTLVTIEATDVPPGITPEDHRDGMTSSLANLARLVE